MRKLKAEDLVGKKIIKADCSCTNITKLTFEDGSKLDVWYELAIAVGSAYIPGAFVDGEDSELELASGK